MIGARCLAALAFAAGVLPAVAADAPPVLATGASPAVAAGVPPAAAAPAGYPAELPPLGRVRSAIEEAPDVRAASALRDAGLAERRQLIAGPHEWSTRAEYRNRRTSDTPVVDRFGECELALERAVLRSGKAELDRRLGDQRVTQAEVALADARHETARRLLTTWYQVLREQAAAGVLDEQAALAAREVEIIARRRQLGDASLLDEQQAQAAAAQTEAAARSARERAERARRQLAGQFPTLAPPAGAALPTPGESTDDLAALGEAALQEDHGLQLARAAAARGRLESERAAAERRPDPTLGIRYGSERAGAERLVGVFVSIPFGGEARRAAADASLARAAAFEQLAEARLRQLSGDVGALQVAVSAGLSRWQAAQSGAQLQARVAERVALSNQLGETGFTEVLLARRQALDAALLATAAHVDVLESRARLLLDAHRLWDFDSPAD
ncbi:MAG: TolC family protein [Burkholderiales bacterium]|nr:TolC family protein [Burkholderiales bacterium]